VKLFISVVVALVAVIALGGARAQSAGSQTESSAQLDAEAAQARQRVIEIVNKPITHLPRTDQATVYSPGWFHPGAEKPDFNTVDVRATQQLIYGSGGYVTSNLNPNEMFIGGDLEFNAMTKYFYTDRTLPKARLSEAEMLEINRLYRFIGRDEQAHAAQGRTMAMLAVALVFGLCLLYLARRFL
jgi:hypothetical protein